MAMDANELLRQANALLRHANYFSSARLLEEFLKRFPSDPRAPKTRVTLGELQLSLAHYDEAALSFERAIRERGESAHVLFRLGQTYSFLGRPEEAFSTIERVLALEPDHEGAIARRASLLQYLGRIDEAAEVIDHAFARGLSGYHLAHAFAGIASALSRRREAIIRLEPYTHDASVPQRISAEIFFTLGRLYDAEQQFDDAWSAYEQGNAIVRPPINIDHIDRSVDDVIATYTREAITSMEQAERSAERVVLIVGMPRSGTTLIEQILGAHPDIAPAGELPALPKAVASIPGRDPPSFLPPVKRVRGNALRRASSMYGDAIDAVSADALRVVDKLPANYCYLGLVPAMLPGAHVIHCRRDPLDTCLSCYFRNFSGDHLIFTDLNWIGRSYRNYVRLMRHWEDVLDGLVPICNADYAEIVSDFDASARGLVESVGLPFDQACLHFEDQKRMSPTLEPEQAGRGVYASSIGRWRNYEKYLGPLIDALGPDLAETDHARS